MAPRRSSPTPRAYVFQLKVTLVGIEPPIWRRILVEGDMTFAKLHLVIQESMGWQDCHLHMFKIGDRRIGVPSPEDPDEWPVDDERRVHLAKSLPEVGAKFRYEYDFGDCWSHEIAIEKLEPFDPRFAYPVCVAGARACPPEDCGGTDGYELLLVKLADAEDEEHDHMTSWIGGIFDSEGFDVNRTNAAIRRAMVGRRRGG